MFSIDLKGISPLLQFDSACVYVCVRVYVCVCVCLFFCEMNYTVNYVPREEGRLAAEFEGNCIFHICS